MHFRNVQCMWKSVQYVCVVGPKNIFGSESINVEYKDSWSSYNTSTKLTMDILHTQ